MQVFRAMKGQQVWVRRVEHVVLRLVSLGFSLASAHAIRWFFAPLDGVDVLQPTITWMIAIGFGVLGYCVSRGLAHRLMNKERIRAYAPICLVVELVEIFCNYALAAAVVQRATWLNAVPFTQRAALTALTYVVLAIIPLVSLLLAVVDMDLERSKLGGSGGVGTAGGASFMGSRAPSFAPGAAAMNQSQPKYAPSQTVGGSAIAQDAQMQPAPTYPQGYRGYQAQPAQGARANGATPFAPVQVKP